MPRAGQGPGARVGAARAPAAGDRRRRRQGAAARRRQRPDPRLPADGARGRRRHRPGDDRPAQPLRPPALPSRRPAPDPLPRGLLVGAGAAGAPSTCTARASACAPRPSTPSAGTTPARPWPRISSSASGRRRPGSAGPSCRPRSRSPRPGARAPSSPSAAAGPGARSRRCRSCRSPPPLRIVAFYVITLGAFVLSIYGAIEALASGREIAGPWAVALAAWLGLFGLAGWIGSRGRPGQALLAIVLAWPSAIVNALIVPVRAAARAAAQVPHDPEAAARAPAPARALPARRPGAPDRRRRGPAADPGRRLDGDDPEPRRLRARPRGRRIAERPLDRVTEGVLRAGDGSPEPSGAVAAGPDLRRAMTVMVYGNDPYFELKARRLLNRLSGLGVTGVSMTVPIFTSGLDANEVHVDPELTPSRQRILYFARAAHLRGMTVTLSPLLDERILARQGGWRGALQPSDGSAWFSDYARPAVALRVDRRAGLVRGAQRRHRVREPLAQSALAARPARRPRPLRRHGLLRDGRLPRARPAPAVAPAQRRPRRDQRLVPAGAARRRRPAGDQPRAAALDRGRSTASATRSASRSRSPRRAAARGPAPTGTRPARRPASRSTSPPRRGSTTRSAGSAAGSTPRASSGGRRRRTRPPTRRATAASTRSASRPSARSGSAGRRCRAERQRTRERA